MNEDEAQLLHEQRQDEDPRHDLVSCWCCCIDCDFDTDTIVAIGE